MGFETRFLMALDCCLEDSRSDTNSDNSQFATN